MANPNLARHRTIHDTAARWRDGALSDEQARLDLHGAVLAHGGPDAGYSVAGTVAQATVSWDAGTQTRFRNLAKVAHPAIRAALEEGAKVWLPK